MIEHQQSDENIEVRGSNTVWAIIRKLLWIIANRLAFRRKDPMVTLSSIKSHSSFSKPLFLSKETFYMTGI